MPTHLKTCTLSGAARRLDCRHTRAVRQAGHPRRMPHATAAGPGPCRAVADGGEGQGVGVGVWSSGESRGIVRGALRPGCGAGLDASRTVRTGAVAAGAPRARRCRRSRMRWRRWMGGVMGRLMWAELDRLVPPCMCRHVTGRWTGWSLYLWLVPPCLVPPCMSSRPAPVQPVQPSPPCMSPRAAAVAAAPVYAGAVGG